MGWKSHGLQTQKGLRAEPLEYTKRNRLKTKGGPERSREVQRDWENGSPDSGQQHQMEVIGEKGEGRKELVSAPGSPHGPGSALHPH